MFEEIFNERITGRRRPKEAGTDRPLACIILKAASSVNEELYVHVPSLGQNERRGPCKWTPIPEAGGKLQMPKGGEQAIMQFDTDGKCWIQQWWPYG